MISGRNALSTIETALQKERGEVDQVDRSIAGINQQLLEVQKARAQAFRSLAAIRVGKIAAGQLVAHIDDTDRQVEALLQQRRQAAEDIADRIRANEARDKALDSDRGKAADELDRAAGAVDEAEAVIQARLDKDPGYSSQREQAEEAERVARHADDKAARSEQEQQQKGSAYRDDPLFAYLWGRHYGTADYRANNLLRWLDGKVAGLIAYDGARPNYQRLQEIPLRLREHAEAKEKIAKVEFESLKALDEKAQQEDGIPALEAQREARRQELDAIDAEQETVAAEHQALLDQQAEFANGEDPDYRKAVNYLASEYRRDDLRELRHEALATPFPEDDMVVSQLFDNEQQEQDLQASANELRMAADRRHERLKDMERLRTDFKRSRYDQPGSNFADGAMVAMMLSNFLSGTLDRKSLWRVLRDQQRLQPRRANPSFGSGGFGRGTVWNGGMNEAEVLGSILGGIARGARRGGFGGFGGLGGGGRGGGRSSGGGGGFRTGGGF